MGIHLSPSNSHRFLINKYIRLLLFIARDRWGYLFNDDPEVVALVAAVMPYCAIFQVPPTFPMSYSFISYSTPWLL